MSAARGTVSEALWRLHSILGRLRWGVFVLAVVAAVYARQSGLVDTPAVVKLYGIALALGLISAAGEYVRRLGVQRRLALLGVALGDWAVAAVVAALGPVLFLQYPFIFFVPIASASLALGPIGGISFGVLSAISLGFATVERVGPGTLVNGALWGTAFLAAGGLAGYVGRQWESAQQHIESTYRWLAELSSATTLHEVGEVILSYFASLLEIRAGDDSGQAETVVALLTADDEDGRFSAVMAKGLVPDVRARLRLSTRDGMLAWIANSGAPVWLSIGDEDGALHVPPVDELASFRSCLVVPIGNEGEPLAIALAFSESQRGQGEVEADAVLRFVGQAAVALQKAMAYTHMEQQAESLANVLDRTRYGGQGDPKEVFQWVVKKARELVRPDAVAAAILDREGELITVAASGDNAGRLVLLGEEGEPSPTAWVLERSSPLIVADSRVDRRFARGSTAPFISSVQVPLRIDDGVFGVLAAGSRARSHFSQNDLMMLMVLGQQVVLALQESRLQLEAEELRQALGRKVALSKAGSLSISWPLSQLQNSVEDVIKEVRVMLARDESDRAGAQEREDLYRRQVVLFAEELHKLYEVVQNQAKEIDQTKLELEQSQVDTVLALAKGLESNYPFLEGSGQEVGRLASAIALRLGASEKEIQDIYYAALLRDIGLAGVPPQMLVKPELDVIEMEMVRGHPTIGRGMLASFAFLVDASVLVGYHHERWDASGYPEGLAAAEIPLGARILAVADAYEALTSRRSYRAALSPQDALDTILGLTNVQFDAEVVDSLCSLLNDRRDVAGWALGDHPFSAPQTQPEASP